MSSTSNLLNFNNYFIAKYTGDFDDGNKKVNYTTQDSQYTIFPATGNIDNNGNMDLKLQLTHVRGGIEQDDQAYISIKYNAQGEITSGPSISWDAGSDAQIPDWVTTGLNVVGYVCIGVEEIAGLFLAPETAGADEIVVQEVAIATKKITKYATKAIEIYNDVAHRVCNLTDDGGRLYFSAIVNQALNNLNSAASEYANHGTIPKAINFKRDLFRAAIGSGQYKDAKDGKAVEYTKDDNDYRTWYPDEGVIYGNTGMLLSCKIDGVRDTNKDDHVALIATFDLAGNLYSAQAVLEMKNETTVTSGTVTYNTQGQVIKVTDDGTTVMSGKTTVLQAIDNALEDAMKASDGTKNYDGYSDARQLLPKIVQFNLQWMSESIVLG